MFCTKCGAEINDEAVVCIKCGCAVKDIKRKRMSGLAVLSFIFSFLLGPVAIILGIIALNKISNKLNSVKGKGLAITGIVIGAITSILFCIGFFAGFSSYKNQAKTVVSGTAPMFLEFKLVSPDSGKLKAAISGDIPEGYELKYSSDDNEPLLLEKKSFLTGDSVKDVSVSFNSQSEFNEPIVVVKLNVEGTKKFAKVTGANIGRRIALIVDGKVQSAPMVREAIPSGELVISGRFSVETAKAIADGLNLYSRNKNKRSN